MNEKDEDNSTLYDESDTDSAEESLQATENPPQIQYQVRHGVFKWSIENFSLFPSREDKYCLSSVFVLKETWWNLALHPKAKTCGLDKISLNIIRQHSDPGPTKVTASYRLGLENAGNKIWFKAEESKIFGKGDCFGFETSLLEHLEDFLSEGVENNDDTLSVLCEIYVKYTLINNDAPDSIETVIDLSLSTNLVHLYLTQWHSDVLIEIPKVQFRAHKCVLSARSRTLSRMLEDGKYFIQLSCTRSCLSCALLFMYSGDFKYLVKNAVFSIGLYELACELSLDKLRDLLTPHKIEQKSQIMIENCRISCTLTDFYLDNIIKEGRESDVYTQKKTGIKVKFCFHKTISSPKLIKCHMDLSGVAEALDFSFKICLLNENLKPFGIIPATFLQNSDAEFKNGVFSVTLAFSDADIQSSLSNDSLSIVFECERCTLTHASNANAIIEMQISTIDTDIWLEDLSSDLEALYRSGKLSDITVTVMDRPFKLHRPILVARSEYFKEVIIFDKFKNKITKAVGFDFDVFDLMCTYMYSGQLSDVQNLGKEELLELYEAAEDYRIKSLIDDCEHYLEINLDPDYVYNVIDVAKKYNKLNLSLICARYICQHGLEQTF